MSDPQKANEFKNLGNEAFKNQDYDAALEHFTKAIECNPNDHTFYSNRSNCYVNLGDYEKALEDANNCIKINPTWPRGFQRKGTALFYMNKTDEAIKAYKEGLEVDPTNAALQQDLKSAEEKKSGSSSGFSGAGGFPGAGGFGGFPGAGGAGGGMNQAYLQTLMKLISHPETKDLIGDPTFMQKMQACMQNPALLQTYMQQDPRLAKAFEVLSQDIPQDFNMEDIMGMKGDKPESKKEQNFKQQQKSQSTYSKPPPKNQKMDIEDPAEAAKNKGNAEFKKRNFAEAQKHYDEAIQAKPQEPLYYNNKAACFIEMGQLENAMAEVQKAEKLFEEGKVKDFSKKAKVFARKAKILAKQDKLDQAIHWYEKSLVEDHNQTVKDDLKKVQKQKKDIEAKAYINPEMAEEHCTQGNALYKDGKFPQALKEYEEAIRRNPNCAKYYSNLGTVYVKLMEFARARDQFDLALEKDPTFIRAYAKKGDAHFALKEYHKALEVYETGLKKEPGNQLCLQGVQKTQQAIYATNSQQDQEARAKRALNDPEIQTILQTPQVRNALAEMERDPRSLHKIVQNPDLAAKIQKLVEAGILRTA